MTAVVLCGGAGTRMGGRDKPLIKHAGKRLIEHVCEALTPLCAQLLVSANRNTDIYAAYGKVIADEHPNGGPLEGVASCLPAVATPWLFVCPGDAPRAVGEVLTRLHHHLGHRPSAGVAVAHDGERRQNLHLLVSVDAARTVRDYLDQGGSSVHGWLAQQDVVEVPMADLADAFKDLDRPGDLD